MYGCGISLLWWAISGLDHEGFNRFSYQYAWNKKLHETGSGKISIMFHFFTTAG